MRQLGRLRVCECTPLAAHPIAPVGPCAEGVHPFPEGYLLQALQLGAVAHLLAAGGSRGDSAITTHALVAMAVMARVRPACVPKHTQQKKQPVPVPCSSRLSTWVRAACEAPDKVPGVGYRRRAHATPG